MITGIDHVEVWAKDLEETVAFYTDVLGFEKGRHTLTTRPDGTEHNQFCVTLGGVMIELFQADPERAANEISPQRMGVNTFALRVDDMAATIAELTSKGVKVSREPRPGSACVGLRAEILDPNGLSIELREWQQGDHAAKPGWHADSDTVKVLYAP